MADSMWAVAAALTAGIAATTAVVVSPKDKTVLGQAATAQASALDRVGTAVSPGVKEGPGTARTEPALVIPAATAAEEDYGAVITPGFLTAEENGWAKIHRGDGTVWIELLDPQGHVIQTLRFAKEDKVSEGIMSGVENGWARLVPVGGGWVRIELYDPQTGEFNSLTSRPPITLPQPPANELQEAPKPPKSVGFLNTKGLR